MIIFPHMVKLHIGLLQSLIRTHPLNKPFTTDFTPVGVNQVLHLIYSGILLKKVSQVSHYYSSTSVHPNKPKFLFL